MSTILSKAFLLSPQTLVLFCALLGLAWAYFLFTHKRGNLAANKYLSLVIFTLAILILRQKAHIDSSSTFYLLLYFISHGLIFLTGPAIYFHIANLTGTKIRNTKVFPHFVPALAACILMVFLFYYRVEIKAVKNLFLLKAFSFGFISLQILHLFFYIYLSRRLVKAYDSQMTKYFSTLSKMNLRWMRHLLLTTLLFAVVILGMYLLIITGGYYEINNTADTLFLVLVAVIIANIVVKSWRQPEVVSGIFKESDKYKTSPLSAAESDKIKERLDQLIHQDQIYLTPELNLKQLADKLAVQPYIVSQLINQEYNQNFFNFINNSRIEFALKKIQSGELQKSTLLGIAYDSGFNSKSTFNRAFKNKMGRTPKEYYKSLKGSKP